MSPKTRKSYESNLKIWFVWIKETLKNKSQLEIKPLEYKKFQNWLTNRGCSSSDINNKRAAISSLNGYIEIYYHDDYPLFRNFINKSIKRPVKTMVNEKQPLNKEEFDHLIQVLTEREDYQRLAYILFAYETGCRREETRQLLKEIVNYKPTEKIHVKTDENGNEFAEKVLVYQTHPIRCKGSGQVGKVRKLTFGEKAMEAIKKWLETRGSDDCPYVFVSHYDGKVKQVGETTFNNWTKTIIEPIVGRRCTPHNFRRTRASLAVVEEGKDIRQVQKLLGHANQSTTEIYVIRHDEDDVDDLF